MKEAIILLGASRSGKDSHFRRIKERVPGAVNLKFSAPAKEWVDSCLGGSFEDDRFDRQPGGFTKQEILERLFELTGDYLALTLEPMRRRLEGLKEGDTPVFTDCRRVEELDLICECLQGWEITAIILPGGTIREPDKGITEVITSLRKRGVILKLGGDSFE